MRSRAISVKAGGLLGLLIGVSGLGFVVYRLAVGWPEVSEALENRRLGTVAAALVVGFAGMSIIGLNWRFILSRFDASHGIADSLYRYFVRQLGMSTRFGPTVIV